MLQCPDASCGRDDHVVTVAPAIERVDDFSVFLDESFDEALSYAALRKAEGTGRPIGSPQWLDDMETRTRLTLRPQKRGPKAKGSVTCLVKVFAEVPERCWRSALSNGHRAT